MSSRQQRRKLERRRAVTRAGMVGGGALALTLVPAALAQAKTYKVTSKADTSVKGTLPWAISQVDSDGSPDTITFSSQVTGSIDLTAALPFITNAVDIKGPGARKLTLNASGVTGATNYPMAVEGFVPVTISGLTMDHGDTGNTLGGFLFADYAALTLSDDTFAHDSAKDGGAVYLHKGSLNVESSTFSDNTGKTVAGAIDVFKPADVKIANSTFTGNSTQYAAGAVEITQALGTTISRSTFSDNAATADDAVGGALYVGGPSDLRIAGSTFAHNFARYGGAVSSAGSDALSVSDSTIADNKASRSGAGLDLQAATATITACTITGNSVSYAGTGDDDFGYGGGISAFDVVLTLNDTIVAGNSASGNKHNANKFGGSRHRDVFVYGGALLTANFSLIQHDTANYVGHGLHSTDITGRSADLGPLANNGGPTQTERPKKGSPVINAGRAFGLRTDQRGDKRKVQYPQVKRRKGSDGTDIGAVERQKPKPKKKHRR
jgi:hypothetical protein